MENMQRKDRKISLQAHKIDSLQNKYDRLYTRYETLKAEKDAVARELANCKEKLRIVESTSISLNKAIEEAKAIQAQYREAYADVLALKSNYQKEMSRLIRDIKL